MSYAPPGTILITGALGNLGRKLIDRLVTLDWCRAIVGVDCAGEPGALGRYGQRVRTVPGDLRDPGDRRWRDVMTGVEAVVHFAAQRPYDDATWVDVCASIDMTNNLLEAAAQAGVRRVVFATSNHVMGGYKDAPLSNRIGAGQLTTELVPAPGTKVRIGDRQSDSTPYATAKLFGERACLAKAQATGGRLTSVAARIGWCQPGENHPRTLNLTGMPGTDAPPPKSVDEERDLRWFRNMWLSNRDFLDLFERALLADPVAWPCPAIVVNGMSANTGMAWDIEATKSVIGYRPQDDVWAYV